MLSSSHHAVFLSCLCYVLLNVTSSCWSLHLVLHVTCSSSLFLHLTLPPPHMSSSLFLLTNPIPSPTGKPKLTLKPSQANTSTRSAMPPPGARSASSTPRSSLAYRCFSPSSGCCPSLTASSTGPLTSCCSLLGWSLSDCLST